MQKQGEQRKANKKSRQLRIRLTDSEYNMIAQKAAAKQVNMSRLCIMAVESLK